MADAFLFPTKQESRVAHPSGLSKGGNHRMPTPKTSRAAAADSSPGRKPGVGSRNESTPLCRRLAQPLAAERLKETASTQGRVTLPNNSRIC